MASKAVIETVETELKHYPGVEMEIRNGGKHDRAVFSKGAKSRFVTIPKTPGDWRTKQNLRRDVKKTLGELGVERLRYIPGSRDGIGGGRRDRRSPPQASCCSSCHQSRHQGPTSP